MGKKKNNKKGKATVVCDQSPKEEKPKPEPKKDLYAMIYEKNKTADADKLGPGVRADEYDDEEDKENGDVPMN